VAHSTVAYICNALIIKESNTLATHLKTPQTLRYRTFAIYLQCLWN